MGNTGQRASIRGAHVARKRGADRGGGWGETVARQAQTTPPRRARARLIAPEHNSVIMPRAPALPERLRGALAHAVSESARHVSLIRPIPMGPAHVKRSASMREVTSAPLGPNPAKRAARGSTREMPPRL